MSDTISFPVTKLDKILKVLTELKTDVARLSEKVEDLEPIYGSDAWWEWSEKKADEDIKAGRVSAVLHNKEELQYFLDSLKTS